MTGNQHYSLFGEPWWLDAVAGPGTWDEVRIESGGRLEARLPFVMRKIYGVTLLGVPPLTQCLGPYFASTNAKYSKELARQKDLVQEMINRLPAHHIFRQNFHHAAANWLPWYWKGYEQTTRYTYVLENLSSEEKLWEGFQSNIRSDVRKAMNRFELQVRSDLGPEVLLSVCQKTFQRQERKGLPEQVVRRIYDACEKRGSGRAFFAVDKHDRVHAALYLVWDERTAYYLLGGGDPELRNSGAHSLIMWEAIKHASTTSRTFDFEGSMVEPVERFFRAFGARQIPYYQVTGFRNRWLKAGWHMTEAGRALITHYYGIGRQDGDPGYFSRRGF
jgi:lipid II:glycine glycyltransferase (peptidoglycan interpeptide bridge formation enzyme)